MALVFLQADLLDNGQEPDVSLAIGRGFEVSRDQLWIGQGKSISWQERLVVVRSFSYQTSQIASLHRRLDLAEKALRALTPPAGRGKKRIQEESTLLTAIETIEKRYQVGGLFTYTYQKEVTERHVRHHKERSARIESQVRFYLTVARQAQAIANAEWLLGWRIYATNAPQAELSLPQAVWAYRNQYLVENIFRRLQGKLLSITPVYVQRDDHAQGLFHLLTIAARLLALGDYLAKEALAQEKAELTGVYAGNPKRGTARPTTERMLRAFDNIHLLVMRCGETVRYQLTPLSAVQTRILAVLGLPTTLYTDLQLA